MKRRIQPERIFLTLAIGERRLSHERWLGHRSVEIIRPVFHQGAKIDAGELKELRRAIGEAARCINADLKRLGYK